VSFASLEGKTALVTGASRGIGCAIAAELASAGAAVVVGYRSGKDEAEALASDIGGRAVAADVSNPGDAARLVEEAGDVDILSTTPGYAGWSARAHVRRGLARRARDEPLFGLLHVPCGLPADDEEACGVDREHLLIVGVHGNWGQTNYAASKAGIIGFTKSLARELGSRNVRANVVPPAT
jgi:NAD(P)-dependent dehydrogenase (short-subunit alcohol dehydrogenase family)